MCFHKESVFAQRNVGDISIRPHSEQGGNETHQVTLGKLVNFINEQLLCIHKRNEDGETRTIHLEKQKAELSRVIIEQASGKFETNVQASDMIAVELKRGSVL